MKPVRIAALAQDEIRAAFDWYEGESEGLGRRFMGTVDRTLNNIAEAPLRYPIVYRNTRRTIVRRFPYGVFFQDRREAIRVLAVVHLRRHPDTWKRRAR